MLHFYLYVEMILDVKSKKPFVDSSRERELMMPSQLISVPGGFPTRGNLNFFAFLLKHQKLVLRFV